MRKISVFVFTSLFCVLAACGPEEKLTNITQHDPDSGKTEKPEEKPEEKPVGDTVSFGAYKHVVIIGMDGAGAFFRNTDTPRCDEIFAGKATTYQSLMAMPTMSAQGWASILHGVLPEFHGCTNSIIEKTPYPENSPYPSIFRVARAAMPEAELASFVEWNPINIGIVENNISVEKGTGADDAEVTGKILTYLKSKTPTLMFVQFSSPDDIGESYGFGTDIYLSTISTVDALVGRIYDQLKLKGILDDTLIMVTADHGGKGKSHGENSDEEKYVFLGVSGKTVANGTIEGAEGRDVAAIAAYALGLQCPDTWTGRVPAGVFKDVTNVGDHKEMEVPGKKYREHETEPTPALSNMENLLSGHNVVAYFPFDGNINDAFGKVSTTKSGTLNYYDAYFGQGVALNSGYVTMQNVKVGTGSFSVAFWLKGSVLTQEKADPGLISNKDWEEGVYKGFILSYRGTKDIKFNVGDGGKNRMDYTCVMPTNFDQGWMHVILTVDRTNSKVRLYFDFSPYGEDAEIPATLANTSFDSLDLNIGQDGTGNLAYKLPAQMDEFIMTSDVLTEADVAAMKAYYDGN
ncbi:MAG: alkaline phosphatase family protein [Bacteroidales bacterium]|nr:alkaline phosphatase family protein [Bacteroidales bacterium]